VRENEPFGGSIVPLNQYRKNSQVRSLMLEFNRAILTDEKTGGLKADGEKLLRGIRKLVQDLKGKAGK